MRTWVCTHHTGEGGNTGLAGYTLLFFHSFSRCSNCLAAKTDRSNHVPCVLHRLSVSTGARFIPRVGLSYWRDTRVWQIWCDPRGARSDSRVLHDEIIQISATRLRERGREREKTTEKEACNVYQAPSMCPFNGMPAIHRYFRALSNQTNCRRHGETRLFRRSTVDLLSPSEIWNLGSRSWLLFDSPRYKVSRFLWRDTRRYVARTRAVCT